MSNKPEEWWVVALWDATVIDHRTGRWTDAARYFDLMDAAIETANGTGEQT